MTTPAHPRVYEHADRVEAALVEFRRAARTGDIEAANAATNRIRNEIGIADWWLSHPGAMAAQEARNGEGR